jgi:hypothetical protein
MSASATDPLQRLRLANPVPSPTPPDWPAIRERIGSDRVEARADELTRAATDRPHRRKHVRPRMWVLAPVATTVACAGVAVLLALGAPHPRAHARSAHSTAGAGAGARDVEAVTPALPDGDRGLARAVAAPDCAVIGPRCAQGCTIPVLSRPPRPVPRSTTCAGKTPFPCVEFVRGAEPGPPADVHVCSAAPRAAGGRLFKLAPDGRLAPPALGVRPLGHAGRTLRAGHALGSAQRPPARR